MECPVLDMFHAKVSTFWVDLLKLIYNYFANKFFNVLE